MLYFILDLYLYFIIDPYLYFKICICILIKSVIACYYRSGFTFSICICIFMRSGINFYLLLNWQNLNIIKGISRIYPIIGAHFNGQIACLIYVNKLAPFHFMRYQCASYSVFSHLVGIHWFVLSIRMQYQRNIALLSMSEYIRSAPGNLLYHSDW